ncbi:MAG: DUF167 domain-containing protein [Spirochaetaceae bacterium]|nr:DUF167 domain-containing protein [Spirochaetaceae bacterium]
MGPVADWPFREEGGRRLLDIKVTPGASKNEILDVREGRLRVKIAAAPEDGKANAALAAFLAETLGIAKKNITIVHGEKSRLKTVAFAYMARFNTD